MMRKPGRERRPVIKNVGVWAWILLETLLEDLFFGPKLEQTMFGINKIKVFFVRFILSFIRFLIVRADAFWSASHDSLTIAVNKFLLRRTRKIFFCRIVYATRLSRIRAQWTVIGHLLRSLVSLFFPVLSLLIFQSYKLYTKPVNFRVQQRSFPSC